MAPNIYYCGAGTTADTEAVNSYQGYISAALGLGGVDVTGPHLHIIYPHGSTDTLPFATMGSSSLAAMDIFEAEYREGLTVCAFICRSNDKQCHLNGYSFELDSGGMTNNVAADHLNWTVADQFGPGFNVGLLLEVVFIWIGHWWK